jgi:preprotein translocase subunit SecE
MIFYNFSIIIFFTGTEIVVFPKINQVFNNFNSKPVMNTVFFVSGYIYGVDFISGYILSLTRSKKLLMLLKTEDICYIDCSPKLANKLIAFVIINILLLESMGIYFSLTFPVEAFMGTQVGRILQIITSIIITLVYFGGIFMNQIIYVYICWIIYTQINNFKIKIITSIQIFNSFFSQNYY